MNANRQVFRNNLTTTRTHLRGVAWINCDARPTSFFRFVGRVLSKLTPRSIADAFVHAAPVAVLHILDTQILKSDNLKFIHQSSTQLMRKVLAPIRDALVDVLNNAFTLASFGRAFFTGGKSTLHLRECLFVSAKEPRVLNLFPGGQCSKVRQPNVHANDIWRGRQRHWFNLTRKTGIPVAQSISPDSQCLDLTLDGAMQLNLDIANFGETQLSIVKQAESTLGKSETIIAVTRLKSWIAWLLSRFHAAEECLECKINSHTCILQRLRICIIEKGLFLLPDKKHFHGIIKIYRALFLLPSVFAYLKSLVINPATSVKRFLHRCPLRIGWVNPVLKCFTHNYIILNIGKLSNRKIVNVFQLLVSTRSLSAT